MLQLVPEAICNEEWTNAQLLMTNLTSHVSTALLRRALPAPPGQLIFTINMPNAIRTSLPSTLDECLR